MYTQQMFWHLVKFIVMLILFLFVSIYGCCQISKSYDITKQITRFVSTSTPEDVKFGVDNDYNRPLHPKVMMHCNDYILNKLSIGLIRQR